MIIDMAWKISRAVTLALYTGNFRRPEPSAFGLPSASVGESEAGPPQQTWFGVTEEATLAVAVFDEGNSALAQGSHDVGAPTLLR